MSGASVCLAAIVAGVVKRKNKFTGRRENRSTGCGNMLFVIYPGQCYSGSRKLIGGAFWLVPELLLAITYPERVMKLILGCTWCCQDDEANGGTQLSMEARKLPIRQYAAYVSDAAGDKPFYRWFLLPTLKRRFRLMKEPETAGLIGQHECISGYNS